MKASSIRWLLLIGLMPALCFAAPQLLYTDISSGPNSGGEDDHGAYLTLYGRHFGSARGDSKVFINNIEVAAYKYWSNNTVSVQPGAAVSSGPIRVHVQGEDSNTDLTFTVRSGRIFFVALDGSDGRGRAGDIHRPFRHAQQTFNDRAFGPGDFLVLRGGSWNDIGDYDNRFMNIGKDGTKGAPLTIMAYPGEEVVIAPPRGITAFRFYRHSGKQAHTVIANFKIRIAGDAECIHMGYGSSDLRIVGNDAQGMAGTSGGAGCVTGSVSRTKILGNAIHDNSGDKLYHALYIDNDQNPDTCDDVEIAYNRIYNQHTQHPEGSGRGIQIYWEGKYRVAFTNFHIHHNVIHDTDRDGITLGNQSGPGFELHDNVIYRTGLHVGAGIRFSGRDLEARVYNNTIYDVSRSRDPGAVWFERAKRVQFFNNIVRVVTPGVPYLDRSNEVAPGAIMVTHNLWYGNGNAPSLDAHPVNADPRFLDAASFNLGLKPGSPAVDAGWAEAPARSVLDAVGTRRPQGKGVDLGAFELSHGK